MDADPEFDKSMYRMNIIDALMYKGGQYLLPLDYSFSFLAYDSSLFNEQEQQALESQSAYTYSRLFEFAKEPYDRVKQETGVGAKVFGAAAYTEGRSNLFSEMFNQNYEEFISIENKKVNLNDGSFEQLLETVKGYSDQGYLNQAAASSGGRVMDMADFEKQRSERYFFKTKGHSSLLTQAMQSMSGGRMRVAFSMGGMSSGNEEDDVNLGTLTNEQGKTNFNFTHAYGINQNSKNKALAWAFIKYLLSDKIQSSTRLSMRGLPVNNKAIEQTSKLYFSGELFGAGGIAANGGNAGGTSDGESAGGKDATAVGEGGVTGGEAALPPDGAESQTVIKNRPEGPEGSEGSDEPRELERLVRPDATGGPSEGGAVAPDGAASPNGDAAAGGDSATGVAPEGANGGGGGPVTRGGPGGGQGGGGMRGGGMMAMFSDVNLDDIVLTKEQQEALDGYVALVNELSDQLNYYPIEDSTIRDVINSEAAHYFDGSRTAREVIDAMQSKINLYLNE
jgi:ABC-type glycerol-3-phosphate transport system substrate-binding protein